MSAYKTIASESNMLQVQAAAPVQQIDRETMTKAVERMAALVPAVKQTSNRIIVAQESILFRTVPGRDMHYYEDWEGKLVRSPDYKYLKNFANFKEQMLSGDDTATLEDSYRPLTADDKERHGIKEECIAAECTIVTARERRKFANEVKVWRDMGFDPGEAVAMARETIGRLGTSAVGVVDPTETTKKGKPITPPNGWSYLQWAEKLAFKNAINRKYGIPTADEMAAMAHHMAKRAKGGDWSIENIDQPIDVQARLADLEVLTKEARQRTADSTADERKERVKGNVTIIRGDDSINDDFIDEPDNDDFERFAARVCFQVPYYTGGQQVLAILDSLDLEYDPENEDFLFNELAEYADRRADMEAA